MTFKTILHAEHEALGAKMVDFHGWLMPLHYGSQLQEHQFVRTQTGMFDVSHMTIVDVYGATAHPFLRNLLSADTDHLTRIGQALYTCMCHPHGGIMDDLIVYRIGTDRYRLVLNSATRITDLAWIHHHNQHYAATILEHPDLSMIAIQGPEAIEKTSRILTPDQAQAVSTLAAFECVEQDSYVIARTGYTGEDGLEIMAPHTEILRLWKALSNIGVKPCGLAARDTLRIEAGLLLYGQDMDDTHTPLESGLSWTIHWQPNDRDFIGRSALISQKQQGVAYKLMGIRLQDQGMMRPGQRVLINGLSDGVITSGTFSPSLGHSIGFARVPIDAPEEVWVEIRNKTHRAQLGKLKFINKGQYS